MVVVAQLVRALDCGSRGRRFETGLPPIKKSLFERKGFCFLGLKRNSKSDVSNHQTTF